MKYVSFLRGINVGGHKKIKMEDLRRVMSEAGFENVQTYIQSGNIIFESGLTLTAELDAAVKQLIQKNFGFDAEVITREFKDIAGIIKNNPFNEYPIDKSIKLYLTFLPSEPEPDRVKQLEAESNEIDRFKILGKDLYWLCFKDKGKSKVTNNYIAQKLKMYSTTRDWNSIVNIAERYT